MTNIIVIRDGIVDENILCHTDSEARTILEKFEDLLDPNDHPNLDTIIKNGYQRVANGAICISHPQTYEDAKLEEEGKNAAI